MPHTFLCSPTVLQDYTSQGSGEVNSNAGSEKEREKEPDSVYMFGYEEYEKWLKQSHQAWARGKFSYMEDAYIEYIVGHYPEEEYEEVQVQLEVSFDHYARGMGQAKRAIQYAFQHAPPEEGEYLVNAGDGGVRLSHVLTNKYLYFFGMYDALFAKKYESGKIPLGSIRSGKCVEGWVLGQTTLILDTGETLHLKDWGTENMVNFLLNLVISQQRGGFYHIVSE